MKKYTVIILLLALLMPNLSLDYAVEGRNRMLTPNLLEHNELVLQNKIKIEELLNEIALVALETEHN